MVCVVVCICVLCEREKCTYHVDLDKNVGENNWSPLNRAAAATVAKVPLSKYL